MNTLRKWAIYALKVFEVIVLCGVAIVIVSIALFGGTIKINGLF